MTDPYALYYPPTNSYPFLLVFFSADGTIETKPFATEEEAETLHGGRNGLAEPLGVGAGSFDSACRRRHAADNRSQEGDAMTDTERSTCGREPQIPTTAPVWERNCCGCVRCNPGLAASDCSALVLRPMSELPSRAFERVGCIVEKYRRRSANRHVQPLI
jgi:hypothetical protein